MISKTDVLFVYNLIVHLIKHEYQTSHYVLHKKRKLQINDGGILDRYFKIAERLTIFHTGRHAG